MLRHYPLSMNNMTKTPTRLKKRIQSWAIQLLVIIAVLLAIEAFLTRGAVGIKAPAIDSLTIKQQAFSLQQFKGKPAIVHFWATWCPVCKLEQGMLNNIASDSPIITVAMQSGRPDEVMAYLEQQGVAYPVVNDPDGWLSSQYKVKAVPTSFILDSEGQIRFATRGYTTGLGLRIRLWLAEFF